MNMTQEELYNTQQDYSRFQRIVSTQEMLTQEEYEFCMSWDDSLSFYKCFDGWLNLEIYSEADYDARELELEIG
jgi:hypothetical protein